MAKDALGHGSEKRSNATQSHTQRLADLAKTAHDNIHSYKNDYIISRAGFTKFERDLGRRQQHFGRYP